MRGCIRVFIRYRSALLARFRPSPRPPAAESGRIKVDLTGIPCWRGAATTRPEALKNRLWLHSADRRATDFLQVAPIETASARNNSPLPSTRSRGSPDRALTTSRYWFPRTPYLRSNPSQQPILSRAGNISTGSGTSRGDAHRGRRSFVPGGPRSHHRRGYPHPVMAMMVFRSLR